MKIRKLCPKVRSMWLLRNALLFVLLAVAVILEAVIADGSIRMALLITTGSLAVILTVFLFALPFLRYKYYGYGYDEKRVYIQYGIIFRHRIVIPVCQIQDLHYFESPFMLIFGIGGVIFSTAGSNFSLYGLEKNEAHKIIAEIEDYLNRRIEEKRNEEIQ